VKQIIEKVLEENDEAILADGFESSAIGVGYRCGQKPVIVYDYKKCIEEIIKSKGVSRLEAVDFFHYNVVRCWIDENSPIFLELC